MIRIAICDDENIICSDLEKFICRFGRDNQTETETEVFVSGNDLCNSLKAGECFDLILLDIEMKNGDGISAGKFIRDSLQDDVTQIAFVLGKNGYDRQLFEFHPLDFVEKPVLYEKNIQANKKIHKNVRQAE